MKKTVLITGGAKGIGRALAKAYYNAGYNVCITFNTSIREAIELEKMGIEIYKLNVLDMNQIKELLNAILKRHSKIDVLVNNAGLSETKLFTDTTEFDTLNVISVNLIGSINVTREVLTRAMLKYKEGSIINISSIWGITGASCEVNYSASKAGMIGFTKALAKEIGPSNIRVNAITPGVIKTDMIKDLNEEELKDLEYRIPMDRLGEVEDIVGVCMLLSNNESNYITGQVISVDGGFAI